MNKKRILIMVVGFALTGILTACGGGGGSAPVETRDVNGLLTGDVSNIKSVSAVRVGDASSFSAQVSGTTSASFTLSLPVNSSYQINLVGKSGSTAATVHFPASAATKTATGSATTKYFTVTNNPVGLVNAPKSAARAASTNLPPGINLGTINVPAGAGADATIDVVTTGGTGTTTGTASLTGTTTTTGTSTGNVTGPGFLTGSNNLTSSLNPLDQDDEDGNGITDSNDSNYRLLAVGSNAGTTTGTTSTTGADTTTGTSGSTSTGGNDGIVAPAGTTAITDNGDGGTTGGTSDNGGTTSGGTTSGTTGDNGGTTSGGTTSGGENGGTTTFTTSSNDGESYSH